MKTYYQNGIVEDVHYFIDKTDEFQIQELDNETQNRFTYPEDSINYALDGDCVISVDTFNEWISESNIPNS